MNLSGITGSKRGIITGNKIVKIIICPPLSNSREGSIHEQCHVEINGGLSSEGCQKLPAFNCLPNSISLSCWEPKKLERHNEQVNVKYIRLPKFISRAVIFVECKIPSACWQLIFREKFGFSSSRTNHQAVLPEVNCALEDYLFKKTWVTLGNKVGYLMFLQHV